MIRCVPRTRTGVPRSFLAAMLLAAVVAFPGCESEGDGDDMPTDTNPPEDGAELFQELGDEVTSFEDLDDLEAADLADLRARFEGHLADDPDSGPGHLGLALISLLEVNADDDLWAFVDSVMAIDDEDDEGRGPRRGLYLDDRSPIIGNELELLASSARELGARVYGERRFPDNVGLGQAQELLEDTVIPALTEAIDHVEAAEDSPDFTIPIEVDGETHEIDLGEIYAFHAALHAARAAFHIVTGWDVDLLDAAGTYDWIDPLLDLDLCEESVELEQLRGGVRWIQTYQDFESATTDSTIVAMLIRNLTERPAFLTPRGTHLADAADDLAGFVARLQDAVDAIRAEGDDQADDLIKIGDLMDLDAEIAEGDDRPDFAAGWTSIEDVLDWAETVATGTFSLVEETPDGTLELDINLSAFLFSGPALRDLLPYHEFTDPATWVSWEVEYENCFEWGEPGTWCDQICDEQVCEDDIIEVCWIDIGDRLDFITLLDGPGGDPLEEDAFPFFPDYTMSGLFPGADRDTWLDAAEALGW